MSWAKLDDTFHAHPKCNRAGLEAVGLYALAISYSAQYDLNGEIDHEWVNQKAGRRGEMLAERLVAAGLWEPRNDGWAIHDYLDYNPSRTESRGKRAAAKERMRELRSQNVRANKSEQTANKSRSSRDVRDPVPLPLNEQQQESGAMNETGPQSADLHLIEGAG